MKGQEILNHPASPFQGWVRELDEPEVGFRASDGFMFGIQLAFRYPEYARALTHTGDPKIDNVGIRAIDDLVWENPINREENNA